ncbi:hypothetical protein HRbin01_00969 [archaeon HR01]|nr:hypothetical protein HRbin01_00969 [archaeon HR01]
MNEPNPIVKMLTWKTRLLTAGDIEAVLASLASLPTEPFTLTELSELLPPTISGDKNKRRSVSSLLSTLQEIGYLYRPSGRKWAKRAASLSHYLSPQVIELSQLEKAVSRPASKDRRVLEIEGGARVAAKAKEQ